tara:strand:+ start:432 stop:569 length:138 start_codon:yes stop_codon:yes gene_type:complete
MPKVKEQKKQKDDVQENLERAVTFLLDELEDMRNKLDKVMVRMGL